MYVCKHENTQQQAQQVQQAQASESFVQCACKMLDAQINININIFAKILSIPAK